jgi:hypothetical protein
MSRHSVVYQLIFHSGFGGHVTGEVQIKNAAELYPGQATSVIVPEKNIAEAFRPKGMFTRLDQDDPNIREGMRITFELLKQMNDTCKQNNIEFMVVVIPVKEEVFSEYLEHNPKVPLDDVIDKLLVNDRAARQKLFQFLSDSHIPYVDPLPELKSHVGEGLYARSAGDMHPGRNGYRVIAESIAEAMKQTQGKN